VMLFVSAITFDWHSIRPATLRRMPKSETAVMLITVAVVVATNNLAIGVGAGVIAAALMFARRVAHLTSVTRLLGADTDGTPVARYHVRGELFFASSNDLFTQFDYAADPKRVIIDLSEAHLWDASTVAALDSVQAKYARAGITAELTGLNQASHEMRERLSGHFGEDSAAPQPGTPDR
ncbi:STAS domain-containing protein, partial [Leucobacter sp. M11]|uniref:STAS domain-containing protein n=1 Tax=Leucobacter sp. M11 TaxID=2993565 RepID=UPI002D803C70